jgi:hypothetical protein
MLTIVIAGITAFAAAMLISAAWSSGGSGSQRPDARPSQSADTPVASPSVTAQNASPSKDPAPAPPQKHGKDPKKHDEDGSH